jgi:hypothetical protein
MSVYNPPTQDQSIFNPSNYGGLGVGGQITTDYLKANFLSFPVAQGNITLVNISGNVITTNTTAIAGQTLNTTAQAFLLILLILLRILQT